MLGAIGLSRLLPALPAWAWNLPKPSALLGPLAGGAEVGWSLVACPGTLALVLTVLFSRWRGLLLLGGHAVVSLTFLWLMGTAGVAAHADEPTVLLGVVIYRSILWLTIAAGLLWIDATERPSGNRSLVAVAVAAAVAVPWLAGRWPVNPETGRLRVTFLWPESGTSAAAEYRTAAGAYGFRSVGLYGEWARVFEREGHLVSRESRLDEGALGHTDLLILASAFRQWHPGEREAVADWVRKGGRLIVVGEHSDLEGCQELLNPLLGEFGLGLNFDTTNGLLGDGLHGVVLTPDPMSRILEAAPALPYNRGGSLEVHGSARPLLVGQYWHADAGDPLAPERAFLSDYRLSTGDHVGDVILMALHEGPGRVLLVGDSTPFLNQNILFSSPFLLRLPFYMAAAIPETIRPRPMVLGGGVILAVLIYLLSKRGDRWGVSGILLVVSGLLVVGNAKDPPSAKGSQSGRLGVVSTAENNVLETDPFAGRSPTALGLALLRRDITPLLGDWEQLPRRPLVVAILNPASRPRAKAFERLKEWIREGTTLLLAGDGDNRTFRELAAEFGVRVSAKPVGNLKGSTFTTYSAWQTEAVPDAAEPFVAEGFVVGCRIRLGTGSAVVFADGGFFLSKNLEMENTFDRTNVAFVEQLLAESPGTDAGTP